MNNAEQKVKYAENYKHQIIQQGKVIVVLKKQYGNFCYLKMQHPFHHVEGEKKDVQNQNPQNRFRDDQAVLHQNVDARNEQRHGRDDHAVLNCDRASLLRH